MHSLLTYSTDPTLIRTRPFVSTYRHVGVFLTASWAPAFTGASVEADISLRKLSSLVVECYIGEVCWVDTSGETREPTVEVEEKVAIEGVGLNLGQKGQ